MKTIHETHELHEITPIADSPASCACLLDILSRGEAGRPGPLKVVAAKLPGNIDHFTDEIET